MTTLTVREFFENKREPFGLELLTDEAGIDRAITGPSIGSPGLILAGYTERAPEGRLQILGETELSYLRSLSPEEMRQVLDNFFTLDMPAVVVTKGQEIPVLMIEQARSHDVPVLRTILKTGTFYRRLQPFLEDAFAPSTDLHGSLADVYGVGLLFIGRSGIGKSECVLDLVERGHRLVADDLVHVSRRGHDVLLGRGHELQRHHMEIRGIGIIDIKALFGIRAIRQQKRIEVVVQLVDWNDATYYDRTGLEAEETDILDVTLPKVTIPLNPGKNITVISEVIAMDHLLKYSGVHSAQQFNERLSAAIRPVSEYLEEDYE